LAPATIAGGTPAFPAARSALQVLASGRPLVVPRVSREPLLADRHQDEDERTFVCVPLLLQPPRGGRAGARAQVQAGSQLRANREVLRVVASMIAQAIKVQRLIEADRERLVQENVRLQGELRERYDFSQILGTSRADA
jgi:Nif-specific regulatory protein